MISKIRFLTFHELVIRDVETPVTVTLQVLAFLVFMFWLFFLPRQILALLIFGGYAIYGVSAALIWRWRLIRRPWEHSERGAER